MTFHLSLWTRHRVHACVRAYVHAKDAARPQQLCAVCVPRQFHLRPSSRDYHAVSTNVIATETITIGQENIQMTLSGRWNQKHLRSWILILTSSVAYWAQTNIIIKHYYYH